MTAATAIEPYEAGHFTKSGRRAALNATLPLLASYFADAETWDLEISQQLAVTDETDRDDLLDDFSAGARLRASLAAAERLLTILSAVTARPTFRYSQVSAESVGAIRGKLDLARYSRQQGRIEMPRRYPIRLVERENATPENVLAAYAALWIRRDLMAAPTHLLPAASPENRELRRLEESLKRALGLPLLAGTAPRAHEIWRRGSLDPLLDQVTLRIDAGHVAHPEPYRELVDWITQTRNGTAVADVGERAWTFYDEKFDTKLFEIWCLNNLAQKLTERIGRPSGPPRSLADRKNGPMFAWNIGIGSLKLYFQPSLSALGNGAVWSYEGGSALRGFPDLAVTTETAMGRRLALLDPKLRRRSGAPTEEIYKLLGYFGNLRLSHPPVGAILYYSPNEFTDYRLSGEDGGELHAVGLDPESVDDTQFASCADLVLQLAGLGDEALALLRTPAGDSPEDQDEHSATVRQQIAVDVMLRTANSLPIGTLAPTRKQTAATLNSIWRKLSDQTQTMIVTAEYFANSAPDDADHSGPLLGLAASVERVLREAIFDPAVLTYPHVVSQNQTLGSCLRTLDNALRNRPDPEAQAVRRVILARSEIDQLKLQNVVSPAKAMNRDFRIPAAHADVVSAKTWARGHDTILHPSNGVLARLVEALGLRGAA